LVSRKSTYICSLKPLPEEDFARLFTQYRGISLRDFLLSLNFVEGTAKQFCQTLGLDFFRRHIDLPNSEDFRTLIKSNIFFEAYEHLRTTQQKNFIAYLKSFEVDFNREGLNIVDVGWKGSIQDNIFLPSKVLLSCADIFWDCLIQLC